MSSSFPEGRLEGSLETRLLIQFGAQGGGGLPSTQVETLGLPLRGRKEMRLFMNSRWGRWSAASLLTTLLLAGVAGSASSQEEEETGWSGDMSLSVANQTGTVDTFSGVFDAKGEREWEKDVASLRLTAAYGVSDGKDESETTTQNAQGLFANWKHTISDRFFWASNSEVSRDGTQDRKARVTARSGPGYRIWQGEGAKEKRHFDVAVGMGYRFEFYDGNLNGSQSENSSMDNYADAIAAFDYKNLLFEDRVEFSHTGSIAMPVNRTEAYIFTTEVILGIPITEAWSFRTSFLYEYVNDVPADTDSNTTRLTVGVGYKF